VLLEKGSGRVHVVHGQVEVVELHWHLVSFDSGLSIYHV
jgi:hypothetical protein